MKRILETVYSTKATLWLLLVFALSMAVATLVEDKYDTAYAHKLIYRAWWFEAVLVLLAINFIGNIQRYGLLSKKKLSGLTFHLAFIVMIIGAGVTRYLGFEGLLHIREGESNNIMLTEEKVLKVLVVDGVEEIRLNIPLEADSLAENEFSKSIETQAGDVDISFKAYYPAAQFTMVENMEGGVNGIKINVFDQGKEADIFLAEHEVTGEFSRLLSFNTNAEPNAFQFRSEGDNYILSTPVVLKSYSMIEMAEKTIPADSSVVLSPLVQYSTADGTFKFIFNGGFQKAIPKLIPVASNVSSFKAFVFDVSVAGKTFEIPVILSPQGFAEMRKANVEGVSLLLGYGEKEIRLPFSITLRDFILERYPGSNAPSSYASEVTLVDNRNSVNEHFRIYMNHILDYDGYRFFQSSYDQDEGGTVLSVNHDFWGTWITYFGYFLLGLGFLWNLLSGTSRFHLLGKSIRELRRIRTGAMVLLVFLFGSTTSLFGQEIIRKAVIKEHAENLGRLIVQTVDGRSEPVHTMAYDVLHKISRKDQFNVPGKGELDAMQVFVDAILDPVYWRNQPMIYVREKPVQEKLGLKGKYASFNELLSEDKHFKLNQEADAAFRKKPQEQNSFDKEVMKVSERFEIFLMMTQGSLLRLFPEPVAGSKVWISWDDPKAQVELTDTRNVKGNLQLPAFNYNNLMGSYLNAAYTGIDKNDYTQANHILDLIEDLQRHSAVAEMIPSTTQVRYEILYNKAGIFTFLRNIYGLLAIVLLVLAYLENFMEKRNRTVSGMLTVFIALLGVAFAYHTVGMGLRWYLSGHAPWSNGYEALLLVGWASILAGFSFLKYSRIPLAATALLAFFTLMTAGHSSYDPQITNLQPVLKSYWLIIHVATLTISYGFLGMAFVLGMLILSFYLLRNQTNGYRITLLIKELSHINEMNITIGLMLATVGTFLGGVWANESWGRYWGWDAKETWALIIVITYSIVIHLRLVEKLRGDYLFTVGSVLGFSSVLMTFIGVNYYLSKGMHSYGQGETPLFPIWGWLTILALFVLIMIAGRKDKKYRDQQQLN